MGPDPTFRVNAAEPLRLSTKNDLPEFIWGFWKRLKVLELLLQRLDRLLELLGGTFFPSSPQTSG